MKNKYRKQPALQPSKKSQKNTNQLNYVLNFLFFIGMILQVFSIEIYRLTLIEWKTPAGLWLIGGMVSFVFLRKYLIGYYDTRSFFMQLFFCLVSGGGIASYLFMAANYYSVGSGAEAENLKTLIIETGHLAKGRSGCAQPYAYVYIKEVRKQLVFPCRFEIEKYNFVVLKLKRGILGFDRIVEKVPVPK